LADPDQNNLQKHLDALSEIKKNGTKGISNQQVSQKAAFDLEHDLAIAGIEIQTEFRRKQMLTTEIKLEESVRNLSAAKSTASTAAMANKIDGDMMGLIQANVATGVITEARGRKLLDDYRLGAVDLDIMNDNAQDKEGSFVYAQLKAGKEGIYHDLSDAERAERLEKTELHIRRNKIMAGYAETKNQDQEEKNLLLNFGGVTEGQVKNLLVGTKIRKSFGESYLKNLYAAPAESTEHAAYNKIKMAQLTGRKSKDINTLIVDNISNLTPEDKNILVESSFDPLDSKTITLRASAEALGKWSTQNLKMSEVQTNEVIFNFFKRIDQNPNGNVDEIMQGVQKDYVKKNFPSTTQLPDVPNIIASRNKIVSVYKKESKMGGKKAEKKPISTVHSSQDWNFDDL
jgi:hypothetical protein